MDKHCITAYTALWICTAW